MIQMLHRMHFGYFEFDTHSIKMAIYNAMTHNNCFVKGLNIYGIYLLDKK